MHRRSAAPPPVTVLSPSELNCNFVISWRWCPCSQCGVKFDPDLPQTLRLEFARSNTKMTKPRQLFSPVHATVHPALASATTAYIHPFTTTRWCHCCYVKYFLRFQGGTYVCRPMAKNSVDAVGRLSATICCRKV